MALAAGRHPGETDGLRHLAPDGSGAVEPRGEIRGRNDNEPDDDHRADHDRDDQPQPPDLLPNRHEA